MRKKLAAIDWRICVSAILIIGGLEALALLKGHDGYLLSLAIGAIAGISGFKLRSVL